MGITRRKFSKEFKVEAVRLVQDRGVSVSQAARDLDVGRLYCAVGYVS
jgi:transposase